MLKNEGLVVNSKRTYQIYRQLRLQVKTQRRGKLTRLQIPMPVPDGINQRWSVDFVCDQLANGRRFRVFSAIDDFSCECVVQITDFSISGERWARKLDQLARTRSWPGTVILGNRPELTSKAMFSGQSAPESNCTSSNLASPPRMPLMSLLMANSAIPV